MNRLRKIQCSSVRQFTNIMTTILPKLIYKFSAKQSKPQIKLHREFYMVMLTFI